MRFLHSKRSQNTIIILFAILIECHSFSSDFLEDLNVRHEIPRNFIESVSRLHEKRKYIDGLKSGKLTYTENEVVSSLTSIKDKAQELITTQNEALSLQFPNVSLPCLTQLALFTEKLSKRESWAVKVFDAYGKPPSGLLEGAYIWAGEFSECQNVSEPALNWQGKYCLLAKPNFPIVYGICIPSACLSGDVASIVNTLVDRMTNDNITSVSFTRDKAPFLNSSNIYCNEAKTVDSAAAIAIVVLAIIIAFVVLGTVYDVFKRLLIRIKSKAISDSQITIVENGIEKVVSTDECVRLIEQQEEEVEPLILKILCSLSLYTNTKKIFNISKSEDQLQCLHAIRAISLTWVILGHTYAFSFSIINNSLSLYEIYFKRLSFLVVSNAFFSVDTFFLMSGILGCYVFLKEVKKAKKVTVKFMIQYYLHRIWRLTPPYMILLMFNATLSRYLGSGPFYPADGFEMNMCKNTWWTNLLYINNFIKTEEMCFGVSWYLANDMQFHWIAPIILIPLAYEKTIIAFILCLLFLIGSFVSTWFTLAGYPGAELGTFATNAQDFMNHVYIVPWVRIGPFIIGIIAGYVLYAYKNGLIQKKLSKVSNIIGWLVSITLCSTLVFGLYPDSKGTPLNKMEHYMYQSFSRTAWATGVGFMIISCVTVKGFINDFLSLQFWVPLSRLSYAAFLVHPVIIYYYYATLEHPLLVQDQIMAFLFVAFLVLSFFGAYVVSVCFEIPLIGLEKFIFKRREAVVFKKAQRLN